MAFLTVVFAVLCLSIRSVLGKAPESFTPLISSNVFGNVTGNTVVLLTPVCYFNDVTCPPEKCFVYLVAARDPAGSSNFDKDKSNSSILTLSPYPTAFSKPTSKNYFLTKMGPLENFMCINGSKPKNFRVGSDGNCSTPNCNGIFSTGLTGVRFKYVLINSTLTNKVISETGWSSPINLLSPKSFTSLNDGLGGRSPSMIAITVILSVLLFLLLLLLIVALVYGARHAPEPMPILGSLRIRRYNPHHMKDGVPQENSAFDGNMKNYTTAEVLPNVPGAIDHLGPQNAVTLKHYNNHEFPEDISQTT